MGSLQAGKAPSSAQEQVRPRIECADQQPDSCIVAGSNAQLRRGYHAACGSPREGAASHREQSVKNLHITRLPLMALAWHHCEERHAQADPERCAR